MKEFVSGFEVGLGSGFWAFFFERCASFGRYTWENASIVWDAEEQLQKLRRTVLKIEDLLKNLEEKMIFEEEGGWKSWYEDLRELAYDADLLLDRISLHFDAVFQREGNESDIISTLADSVRQLKFPFDTTKIQEKLDQLILEFESLVSTEKGIGSTAPAKFPGSTSFVMNESLVGRAVDMTIDIVGLINSGTSCGVISVVGAGGIGKTALAQAIYNDSQLPSFTHKVWVHVGQSFDLIRTTRCVIEQLTLKCCFLSDLETLQTKVRSLLHGKRILLVLDDCWNESLEDWDTFSAPFGFSSTWNMAIVTTRSLKTSSLVSSDRAHQPELLTDDDCWELIQRKALPCIVANPVLEQIGNEISKKKCRGLPLIANTLGDMLMFSKTETKWISILEEDELWNTPQGKNVFRSLVRSYIHLPPNLRKCFAYCSLFPESHEYDVEELELLWMAEGLITAVGSTRPKDLGRVYFDDLYSRSLFQKKTLDGDLYIMHPAVHDMARFVSKDTCLHSQLGCCPFFGKFFHLSLVHDGSKPLQGEAFYKYEKLRSLLVTNSNASGGGVIDPGLLSKCKSLRVFSLTNLGLTKLDKDTFNGLDFMRYLDFSGNQFLSLPESICKLVALQTLKLTNCPLLRELPDDMKNLRNLRNLVLDKDCGIVNMPPGFGELTGLQILTLYVVGSTSGIAQLCDMDHLRGSLCIKGVELIKTVADAKTANLGNKKFLNELDLRWTMLEVGSDNLYFNRMTQANVLNKLRPHINLKEIMITGYCGTGNPHWLSERGRMLTRIHLVGLKYCAQLPCLGRLPCLKTFVIKSMPCLTAIGNEFYGPSEVMFPRLERFQLEDLPLLESWSRTQINDTNDMPSLLTFSLSSCPELRCLPLRLQNAQLNPTIDNCPMLPLQTLP